MEKFEFNVKIDGATKEEAKTKLLNLLSLAKKISSEELDNLKMTIETNPNIVPFIREISSEYDMKNIGLVDVISIAKKAYTKFK